MKIYIILAFCLLWTGIWQEIEEEIPHQPEEKGFFKNIMSVFKGSDEKEPPIVVDDEKSRFFVIGDFGSFTKYFGLRKSALMMESLASRVNYSHIITVGDNFYLKGIPDIESRWHPESILDIFNREFTGQLPIYATLGNHDCYSDYRNEILFSNYHDQWTMPSDYYELVTDLKDGSGKTFVNLMLNSCKLMWFDGNKMGVKGNWAEDKWKKMKTEIGSEEVLEHYSWLEEKLKEYSTSPKTAWLAVTIHHPPFLENALKDPLLTMLRKYKVDFIFTGHYHYADYSNMDPDYITKFPPEEPKEVKRCLRKKEFLLIEPREQTFSKGEKLHQFISGNGGTFLMNICPLKEQDGDLYFRNRGYNGIAAVEATEEKVTVSFHRDSDDIVYRINILGS